MYAKLKRSCLLFTLIAGVFALTAGAAWSAASANFDCAPDGKVTKEIAPEAELVELTCFTDVFNDKESLHLKVTFKNKAAEDLRFRINIFLPDGKAVGGLVPEKGKPPVVKAGETASFTYPVQGYTDKPGEITLVIKSVK